MILRKDNDRSVQGSTSKFTVFVLDIVDSPSVHYMRERLLEELDRVRKLKLEETKENMQKLREMVLRLIFAEQFGISTMFAWVKVMGVAALPSPLKQIGYQGVQLTVDPSAHQVYLFVATIQRDLASRSYLDVSSALSAVASLRPAELLPGLLPLVVQHIAHDQAEVRKRVSMALQGMFLNGKEFEFDVFTPLQTLLADRDPSVAFSAIAACRRLASEAPAERLTPLVPLWLAILQQLQSGCLPITYSRSGVSAPWTQIQLLQLMNLCDSKDELITCHQLLLRTLDRYRSNNSPLSVAIRCEVLLTIASLRDIPEELLTVVSKTLKHLIHRTQTGTHIVLLRVMSKWIDRFPDLVQAEMDFVFNCIGHPTDVLRRRGLLLLIQLLQTSSHMAQLEATVSQLLDNLPSSVDDTHDEQKQFPVLIAQLILKQAETNPRWGVETMFKLLKVTSSCRDSPALASHVTQFLHVFEIHIDRLEAEEDRETCFALALDACGEVVLQWSLNATEVFALMSLEEKDTMSLELLRLALRLLVLLVDLTTQHSSFETSQVWDAFCDIYDVASRVPFTETSSTSLLSILLTEIAKLRTRLCALTDSFKPVLPPPLLTILKSLVHSTRIDCQMRQRAWELVFLSNGTNNEDHLDIKSGNVQILDSVKTSLDSWKPPAPASPLSETLQEKPFSVSQLFRNSSNEDLPAFSEEISAVSLHGSSKDDWATFLYQVSPTNPQASSIDFPEVNESIATNKSDNVTHISVQDEAISPLWIKKESSGRTPVDQLKAAFEIKDQLPKGADKTNIRTASPHQTNSNVPKPSQTSLEDLFE